MRGTFTLIADERGQMSVELAALTPVIVVVALVVYNLARFVALCAVFDRVAPDAIIVTGISSSGEQSRLAAVEEVRSSIMASLDAYDACDVEVTAQGVNDSSDNSSLSLASYLTRFTCTLVFRPWPRLSSLAGVRYDAPFALRHERSLVVDRFRPGVVM